MSNLEALLSKTVGDVRKPKPKPAGWYMVKVNSAELVESSKKKTPGIKFELEFLGAHESVDPSLLEGVKITGTKKEDTFWLTEDSLYRLVGDSESGVKGFAQHCGQSPSPDASIMEVAQSCVGATLLVELIQKPNQTGDSIYNEVVNYKSL